MAFDIPASLGVLIPLFALTIPIVKVLTNHQQKMAELLGRQQQNTVQQNPNEIQELRQMVTSLALSVESLRDEVRGSNIQDRVKETH